LLTKPEPECEVPEREVLKPEPRPFIMPGPDCKVPETGVPKLAPAWYGRGWDTFSVSRKSKKNHETNG